MRSSVALLLALNGASATLVEKSTESISASVSIGMNARIEEFTSETHKTSSLIVSHGAPLKNILQHLSTLEEDILGHRREVVSQAALQDKMCTKLTRDIQRHIDENRDDLEKKKKIARALDADLRNGAQAKEEKKQLLLQLQEQNSKTRRGSSSMGTDPPPLERAAGAIESDDDSKELNEKTKHIRTI